MASPTDSLIQKLETFAASLSEPEREVLGEILLNSVDTSKSVDEVAGYLLTTGQSSLLGGSILGAQSSGKDMTRLHLQTAPGNLTLAMAGARSRLQQ